MKIHADAGQGVLGAACSAVIAGKNLEMAPKSCEVLVRIDKQSPDITGGVHVGKDDLDVGAGDQVTMFGYASDEAKDCMFLAHGPRRLRRQNMTACA